MSFPLPLGLLVIFSQVLDAVSSWIGLEHGSIESNALYGQSLDRMVAGKIFAMVLALIAIWIAWRVEFSASVRQGIVGMIAFAAGVTTMAALSNLGILI